MSTVTWNIARWAAQLTYEQLPEAVVAAAKRFLLDSVGCALGGAMQPDVALMRRVLDEVGGAGPATTLVSGEGRDPASAALLNSLLIRVMDYNDIYWQQDPSHPSDLIPAAMAAAERAGGSGRDLLLGVVLAYELEQRLCEVSFPGVRELGWHHATLTALAAPAVAGRLLGLDAAQIQHAIGISGSRHCVTGSVTAGKLTMMKNTVDPLAVQSGVLAALLAGAGYTGPEHVLDGKEGLSHVIPSQWKWEVLTEDLGQRWAILECGMKFFPTEALTHAPISAVLELVQAHDLAPEQVAEVEIRSLARAADILADPSKYDPRSKETADHSLPYVVAAALTHRQVTPRQFTDEAIADERLRAQLPKVKVKADPEIEALFPGLQRCRVIIRTVDGAEHRTTLDYPKGDPRNPLSEAEIVQKAEALAADLLRSRGADPAGAGALVGRMAGAAGRAESFERATELMAEFTLKSAGEGG